MFHLNGTGGRPSVHDPFLKNDIRLGPEIWNNGSVYVPPCLSVIDGLGQLDINGGGEHPVHHGRRIDGQGKDQRDQLNDNIGQLKQLILHL